MSGVHRGDSLHEQVILAGGRFSFQSVRVPTSNSSLALDASCSMRKAHEGASLVTSWPGTGFWKNVSVVMPLMRVVVSIMLTSIVDDDGGMCTGGRSATGSMLGMFSLFQSVKWLRKLAPYYVVIFSAPARVLKAGKPFRVILSASRPTACSVFLD